MATIVGDLHWEFLGAGEYETEYFVNGYKYRVVKDGYSPNIWYAYYKWHKTPRQNRQWKRLRYGYGSSHDTKKAAQTACWTHNQKPRSKWKYIEAVSKENAKTYDDRQHIGWLKYEQVNSETGEKLRFTATRYLNPGNFYFLCSYIGNREGFEDAIQGVANART